MEGEKTLYAFTVEICTEWINHYKPFQEKGLLFASSYADAAGQLEDFYRNELCSIERLYAYGEYGDDKVFVATDYNLPYIKEMLESGEAYDKLEKE